MHLTSAPAEAFTSYEPNSTCVQVADKGAQLRATGKGTLEVGVYDDMDETNDEILIPLTNVLKCNAINNNLLSVSQIIDELGVDVVFRQHTVQFLQEDVLDYSSAVVFEGERTGKLWSLKHRLIYSSNPESALGTGLGGLTDPKVQVVHEQYNHAPLPVLKNMCGRGYLDHHGKLARKAIMIVLQ